MRDITLIGDDGVDGVAVELGAAVEEAELDEETDLDNLRADFADELGGGGGGSAGGEEIIEQQHSRAGLEGVLVDGHGVFAIFE